MRAMEVRRLLAQLAERQWGLVTAPQARAAGVTYVRLTRLTQAGVLRRLAHGVYLLEGAATDEHLDVRAAWLGLEPTRQAPDRVAEGAAGAVISHVSAAAVRGLCAGGAARYEFTVPGRKQSRRRDIRLHRGSLKAEEITTVAGMPVTTMERTIVDLIADGTELAIVAELFRAAQVRGCLDLDDLADRLEPYAARRGFADHDGAGLMGELAAAPALQPAH